MGVLGRVLAMLALGVSVTSLSNQTEGVLPHSKGEGKEEATAYRTYHTRAHVLFFACKYSRGARIIRNLTSELRSSQQLSILLLLQQPVADLQQG